MASDSRGDSRRKHRRSPSSSDEEVERTSKRHKHRHRHRRSSKRHEEDMKERDEDVCSSPPPTPLPPPPPSVAAPNSTPDDDLEEGEILEEEGLNSDEGKVSGQSKIQNLGDDVGNDTVPEEVIAAGTGSNEKTEDFCPSTDGIENGGFGSESHKDSQQQRKPSSFHKGNGNQSRHSDVDSGESRDSALSGRGKSSRSSGKRYEELQLSPSRESCRNGVYIEKNTNSVDYVRERSHSQSTLLDDDIRPKAIHRGESESYYAEKSRADYDSDDRRSDYYSRDHRYDSYHAEKSRAGYDSDVQRKDRRGRDNRHDSRDYVRSEGREESESYSKYSRREEVRYHSRERDAHSEQRREEREKWRDVETDRDYRKRRDRERSIGRDNRARDRDMEQERRRDDRRGASRDRGNDMDRRRERGRSVDEAIDRDKDRHRDRSKEKVRERSKDRTRDSKRERYREREIKDDERNADRERQRKSEKWHSDNKSRGHDRDVEGDRTNYGALKEGHDNLDRYKRPKHSGRDGLESHQDKSRKEDLEKVRTLDRDLSEGGERKPNSDKDERQDMDESITFDLTLNEEEDIEKIKEESRRRRQAIMDKYKNKQQVQKVQQQDVETAQEDLGKGLPTESVTAAATLIPGSSGGSEGRDTDHSFSVGKSPQTNGSDAHDTTGAGGLGEGSPKSERSEDMFYDDIFGESPAGVRKSGKGGGLHVERSGLHDNWDDAEGYYSYRFGEILDGRYEVIAAHGKGVFSTVVRAKDLKAGSGEPQEVAVKILRNKEAMYKAGVEELGILNKLVGADPDDKRHCVRLLSSFKYRNHLCLVFESLSMNLREVLKKFGRNIGLKLTAVRAYAKQLFIVLKHLRNCGVLHCDIKPDNMLVNEAKNVLKLCDFGNAMYAGKNEITPYLVSRFYRAPEIILGLPYDHPMDIWSVGCSLYELYTGKVLFPGPSNNDMLRLHMELKGPVPKKMLRKGGFVDRHFDQDLNFLATEEDPVTKKSIKRMILNIKPKDIGTIIKGSPGEDPKMLANFKDLLDKIFVLDPEKRMTVQQALNHPFITGK